MSQFLRNIPLLVPSLLLVSSLLLSACGQKGALFIPDEHITQQRSSEADKEKNPQSTVPSVDSFGGFEQLYQNGY